MSFLSKGYCDLRHEVGMVVGSAEPMSIALDFLYSVPTTRIIRAYLALYSVPNTRVDQD